MKKQIKIKERNGIDIIYYFAIIGTVLMGVAIVFAVQSTGEHIGIFSAMKLSMCHPMFTDTQCIGEEKAKIISNLRNDGKDTHGIQIFYNEKNLSKDQLNIYLMKTYFVEVLK